ncbi:MAG: ATP synthase subunit I [Deltaproteobacteria bacterium]|nr:ATP synthase subunit I [Deltaproteobacteria bacterium]MBW2015378.1 ATP synthase subunit I [Deltaproteobacteria bacterium]MBW2128006.1 ATP synthase subunit I [Deltaproteobacteria bacterium]MBW2302585.1 ATP synthase subunit I [Deltaproteobacteria bacterium]
MKKRDSEVIQVQKRICSRAMLGALLIAFFFLAIHEKALAKGLVLGTLFSVVNFLLIGQTIPLTIGRSRAQASLIGLTSILGRYAILAVPLVLAIKSPSFSFVTTVVGIFGIQMVTLFDYVFMKPKPENRSH